MLTRFLTGTVAQIPRVCEFTLRPHWTTEMAGSGFRRGPRSGSGKTVWWVRVRDSGRGWGHRRAAATVVLVGAGPRWWPGVGVRGDFGALKQPRWCSGVASVDSVSVDVTVTG